MAKFAVNKGVNNTIRRDIDADHYKVDGEFIHFYDAPSRDANVVLTLATKSVFVVEVDAK